EQRDHPLVSVLTRLQPSVVPQNGYTESIGIPQVPYLAVPLHSPVVDEEPRLGVLIVNPILPRVVREARWVADVLGPRIAHLRAYRGYAENQRRLDRDRNLLQGVIDAVSDPILLTDTAGRMLIANPTAERLFTPPKGAPEEAVLRVGANDAHFSSFVANLLFSGETMRYRGDITLTEPLTGRTNPFEAVAGKILSEHGELIGVVTILHD